MHVCKAGRRGRKEEGKGKEGRGEREVGMKGGKGRIGGWGAR